MVSINTLMTSFTSFSFVIFIAPILSHLDPKNLFSLPKQKLNKNTVSLDKVHAFSIHLFGSRNRVKLVLKYCLGAIFNLTWHQDRLQDFINPSWKMILWWCERVDISNNRLQLILDRQGLTQKELAKMVKMHQGDISEIAAGKKERLTLKTAAKIAVALGNSVEYIWPGLFP